MEASPQFPHCTVQSTVNGYFEQQWPDIDSHAADSLWQGEIMDYGHGGRCFIGLSGEIGC